ncbi:MAG: hypothetical protein ACYCQI_01180 [Gammaproteobacteria bacterium]
MAEVKEPEAPPIPDKFVQHLPSEPMVMIIESEELTTFLNARKKSTEPVRLTESLLMIELPDGTIDLFDITKNKPADPALAANFSKMYTSLAEKEKSFGLDHLAIGQQCCIAVDKPDQVYVLDTTDLANLSIKKFTLPGAAIQPRSHAIQIFPDQNHAAILAKDTQDNWALFILDIKTGQSFKIENPHEKSDVLAFDILRDQRILGFYTESKDEHPLGFKVVTVDFAQQTANITGCKDRDHPEEQVMMRIINLNNNVFVTLSKPIVADKAESFESGAHRYECREVTKSGEVRTLKDQGRLIQGTTKQVCRLSSGMAFLIDYQKESELPFVRRIINPIDRSMRDIEASDVYPNLQFQYFPNTLILARGPNVPSKIGLYLIPVPVAPQMDAGLDEELFRRIPVAPLGEIIKQYMIEPPDKSRLIRLSPDMPAAWIGRFKDMKREGISIEFNQHNLMLSRLPEINVEKIKKLPDLINAITEVNENIRKLHSDLSFTHSIGWMAVSAGRTPKSIASIETLMKIMKTFENELKLKTSNPTDVVRHLVRELEKSGHTKSTYFKDYKKFFHLDDLLNKTDEVFKAQEMDDMMNPKTRGRR